MLGWSRRGLLDSSVFRRGIRWSFLPEKAMRSASCARTGGGELDDGRMGPGKRGGEIEVIVAFLYVHTECVCD